jgi:hypothetical protein
VERTLGWLHRFRRVPSRHECRADIHQAFLTLACTLICWNYVERFVGRSKALWIGCKVSPHAVCRCFILRWRLPAIQADRRKYSGIDRRTFDNVKSIAWHRRPECLEARRLQYRHALLPVHGAIRSTSRLAAGPAVFRRAMEPASVPI